MVLHRLGGTVRSRNENSSGERESQVEYRAQEVKSHCVQSRMARFVSGSRNLRLRTERESLIAARTEPLQAAFDETVQE